MNQVIRALIILEIISLIGGVLIFYQWLPHKPFEISNNIIIEVLALSFWYIEPIISIILIFGTNRRKIKYIGAFFLTTSIYGWIRYVLR